MNERMKESKRNQPYHATHTHTMTEMHFGYHQNDNPLQLTG
jgi:hypothetical protein